jgi:diacylglycerol kinase (ATP)
VTDASSLRPTPSGPSAGLPFGRAVLIARFGEARGRVGAELAGVEERVRSLGLEPRVARAEDSVEPVAREAVRSGERFLVAVGGDRTVNEVVNGILAEGAGAEAVLGVVAAGVPCDFIRTFGLPPDPDRACRYLAGDRLFPIDAVRVSYRRPDGEEGSRYFVNLAEVGLGAAILRRTEGMPAWLGRGRRFLGFWLALAAFRPRSTVLRGDRRSWEGRPHNVVVANCQYHGEGYRISPRSWPDDGFVDVLVMKGPKADAFRILYRAYLGEHLPHPNIVEYRSRRLQVEADRPLPVQADGMLLGTTPASFEVAPKAIRLKI